MAQSTLVHPLGHGELLSSSTRAQLYPIALKSPDSLNCLYFKAS